MYRKTAARNPALAGGMPKTRESRQCLWENLPSRPQSTLGPSRLPYLNTRNRAAAGLRGGPRHRQRGAGPSFCHPCLVFPAGLAGCTASGTALVHWADWCAIGLSHTRSLGHNRALPTAQATPKGSRYRPVNIWTRNTIYMVFGMHIGDIEAFLRQSCCVMRQKPTLPMVRCGCSIFLLLLAQGLA